MHRNWRKRFYFTDFACQVAVHIVSKDNTEPKDSHESEVEEFSHIDNYLQLLNSTCLSIGSCQNRLCATRNVLPSI